jgi:hypothetical protein
MIATPKALTNLQQRKPNQPDVYCLNCSFMQGHRNGLGYPITPSAFARCVSYRGYGQ